VAGGVLRDGYRVWLDSFWISLSFFFLVKKAVESIWSRYGRVEVSSMENGMYIFRFNDEKTRDAVLEANIWHIAKKPVILRKWQPRCNY
jgi:hypothetical protein